MTSIGELGFNFSLVWEEGEWRNICCLMGLVAKWGEGYDEEQEDFFFFFWVNEEQEDEDLDFSPQHGLFTHTY